MIGHSDYSPIVLTPDIPLQAREWRNDVRVWAWCRQNTLISKSEQDIWLDKITNDPTIKMFGIRDIERGLDVGVCGFTAIDYVNRSAEFSLYIASDKRGQSLGKKALQTLLMHGFIDLGFIRIWGETFFNNPAIKTFKEIGFKPEGVLRKAYWNRGQFTDTHIFSLLLNEWCATNMVKLKEAQEYDFN